MMAQRPSLTFTKLLRFIVNLLFFSWLSEKLNERFLLATISQWWALALLIALEVLPADRSPWVAWVLSVLLYAMPYFHAVLVAVTSRNAGSVRTRTVASAIYNMCVQASNIIGNNVRMGKILETWGEFDLQITSQYPCSIIVSPHQRTFSRMTRGPLTPPMVL